MSTKHKTIDKILGLAKQKIENELDLSNIDSGIKFENYVTLIIEEIANNYGMNVEQTGAQSFPDIIIGGTFGIEVKYTKSRKWESTGNSIFEGTFRKDVTDQIYTFFGRKVDKKIEVRYKLYEDCLAEIKVTHSPRFYLNMDIDRSNTILNKIGISYAEFKGKDRVDKSQLLKEYVRSTLGEGESLWWLEEEKSISPKVMEFRSLQSHQKENIKLEAMALFPEVFSSRSTKYLNLSIYLLQEYQIVSSSLRDAFSAGGQCEILVNNSMQNVSQIYGKLYNNALGVQEIINSIELDKLKEYWSNHADMTNLNDTNRVEMWKQLLNYLAEGLPNGIKGSDIFEEGLNNSFF